MRQAARKAEPAARTLGGVVFNTGRHAPHGESGGRLLAHELTHVVQQSGPRASRRLQRFTAALGGDGTVSISPEKGDTDADLDRVLCPTITDRKIRGRTSIDVSACFPPGTAKAMTLGPANCSDFVNKAMGRAGSGTDFDSLMTPKLWEELLKKGHKIRGFAVMKEDGKVEKAEGLSWTQLNPKMGDVVFMKGSVLVKKGKTEPDPKGDDFTVTWDHVGFFIVRSRKGFDFHLAKDGDENPLDVYRTGMELSEGLAPGAYVSGTGSLMAYLGPPGGSEEKEKADVYIPGTASRAYSELPAEERTAVNEETDRRFSAEAGTTRKLDWDDPKDRAMARKWLRLRDKVMAERKSGKEAPPTLQRAIRDPGFESGAPAGAPPIVHEVLRSPGRPLDAATRAFFEPRFGVDFGATRVHTDSRAAASARAVDALAYTVGNDVVFDTGQYAPHLDSGKRLLAHELTHVVQQSGQAFTDHGRIQRRDKPASDTPELKFEPAKNKPPCACVVFVHREEQKAERTARLMFEHCKYNLVMVQDPSGGDRRLIDVPQNGQKDPNSMFAPEVIEACMTDDKGCRDFVANNKASTKKKDVLAYAQGQYFLAVKDCSEGFSLPVIVLHNNSVEDTKAYRKDKAAKGVEDLKLDVDKSDKKTGADVIETMRQLIKDKFGTSGLKQTMEKEKTTNIFRWCALDDLSRCHVGDPEHPDNVVWVTNLKDYETLSKANVNVVYQGEAKSATAESKGDLSTMFVILMERLQKSIDLRGGIGAQIIMRFFHRAFTSPTDWQAQAADDARLKVLEAEIARLQDELSKLRFVNIETAGEAGKDWGTAAERVENYRAIVSILKELGLHCCDADAEVEKALIKTMKRD